METKLIELRDRGIFSIPAIAISTMSEDSREHWLLRRAGYAPHSTRILFGRIDGSDRLECYPYAWGDRTFAAAHAWIEEHWADIRSGDVVDVRYILGETPQPCDSEQWNRS